MTFLLFYGVFRMNFHLFLLQTDQTDPELLGWASVPLFPPFWLQQQQQQHHQHHQQHQQHQQQHRQQQRRWQQTLSGCGQEEMPAAVLLRDRPHREEPPARHCCGLGSNTH